MPFLPYNPLIEGNTVSELLLLLDIALQECSAAAAWLNFDLNDLLVLFIKLLWVGRNLSIDFGITTLGFDRSVIDLSIIVTWNTPCSIHCVQHLGPVCHCLQRCY